MRYTPSEKFNEAKLKREKEVSIIKQRVNLRKSIEVEIKSISQNKKVGNMLTTDRMITSLNLLKNKLHKPAFKNQLETIIDNNHLEDSSIKLSLDKLKAKFSCK